MKRKPLILLAFLAALLRAPALFQSAALLPPVAPAAPLTVWLQAWLDAQSWGWSALGWLGLAADVLSTLLLATLVQRRRRAARLLHASDEGSDWSTPGFWAGLAWAVNPVALTLAGSAGAWQSVALAALLVGAWNLEYSVQAAAEARAAYAFALAVAVAAWPVLLLPAAAAGLLSRRDRWRFYRRAVALPLLLSLPWFLLNAPATVLRALEGAPSLLGMPGTLRALWSAVDAPGELLTPLLGAWKILALLGLPLLLRRVLIGEGALVHALACSAWSWALLCPAPQGPLYLAPLGLMFLLPGRIAWRLTCVTLPLLLLHDRWSPLKALFLNQTSEPADRFWHLIWAALCLAWFAWAAIEWARQAGGFRTAKRSTSFR